MTGLADPVIKSGGFGKTNCLYLESSSVTGVPPIPQWPSPEEQYSGDDVTLPLFRVLLAEDNAADVMVIEEILSQQAVSFEIVVAPDGQQAIHLLQRIDKDSSLAAFDIALVDLNLPKHTGHEVLAELRKTTRSGAIPVITVTSSRSPRDIKRARELGATDYFQKAADLDAYSALGALVVRTLQRNDPAKR